jgi:uncharacterized protein with NRDE domain
MCTVTYVPQPGGHFILSSNRDEQPARASSRLTTLPIRGQCLLFPRDEGAGGAWIVAASSARIACLLNGAFQKYEHRPPYRRSRGLMTLDLFAFPSADDFWREYLLEGIAPFTLIAIEPGRHLRLVWDGRRRRRLEWDPLAFHIWSSATLYDPAMQEKRQRWFAQWRAAHIEHGLDAILNFHLRAGENDPWNDVVMNRHNVVRTVSVTNVIRRQDSAEIRHHDLLRDEVRAEKIALHDSANTKAL